MYIDVFGPMRPIASNVVTIKNSVDFKNQVRNHIANNNFPNRHMMSLNVEALFGLSKTVIRITNYELNIL